MTNSGVHRVERAIGHVLAEECLDHPGRDECSDDEPLPHDVRARDRFARFVDVLPDFVRQALTEILRRDGLLPRGTQIPHGQISVSLESQTPRAVLASMRAERHFLEKFWWGHALRTGEKAAPSHPAV